MAFQSGNKFGQGRPRGARNKRGTIDATMQKKGKCSPSPY